MVTISDKKQHTGSLDSLSKKAQQKPTSGSLNAGPSWARQMGNRAIETGTAHLHQSGTGSKIQRACHCGGTCAGCASKGTEDPRIQAKLSVGPVNDVYEQEADQIADHVMRIPDASKSMIDRPTGGFNIQRIASGDEGGFDPGPDFKAAQEGGRPLSEATRQYMEPRFAADFSAVRVHDGSAAQHSAAQIQAQAYTTGQHITLGKGASESDHRLMAHELTHVVQQGGAADTAQRVLSPRIQRDPPPAADPCPGGVKKIDVYSVNLPGSTRSIYDDEAKANAVLAQCCARINITGGESWDTNLMDTDAPLGVLNHSTATATTEVQDMTAHRPGGNVLHAYYVPSISIGSRGSSFYASRYGGTFPSTANAIQVANSAANDTMVHELVHVLLDDGGHHADPDNLMASGGTRNVGVDNMDAAQCAGI